MKTLHFYNGIEMCSLKFHLVDYKIVEGAWDTDLHQQTDLTDRWILIYYPRS